MRPLQLPSNWDHVRDLLVLVGSDAAELAHAQRAAGQVRIYVVAPEPVAGLPDDVACVATPSELLGPIVAAKGGNPGRVVVHPTGDPWATRELRDAVTMAVREAVRSRMAQRVTVQRSGSTWLNHGLRNLPALAHFPAITTLYGRFKQRTAFVCAPGPSLSEAIPHLRANRENCLIIAVSHALKSLVSSGIDPDIVIAADPGNLDRHFAGVDSSRVGALAVAATGRPSLFDVPARTHFHFAGNGRTDDWLYGPLNVDARLASGGSVSCSAASLAILLGCPRVVFCGLDLSFPEGRYYAEEGLDGDARVQVEEGSFFLRKEAGAEGSSYSLPDGGLRFSADQRIIGIRSVDGGVVSTSPALSIFLAWFESLAAEVSGHAVLVQTSRAGAFIPGFEHHTIQEEVERSTVSEPRFDDVARSAVEQHDEERAATYLNDYFSSVRKALPLVVSLSQELTSLAHRTADDPNLLPDLQRGEQELRGAIRPLGLLTVAAFADFQRAEDEARAGTCLADNMRATRRIFSGVERAARLVESPLEEGLDLLGPLLPSYASDASSEAA